MDKSGILSAVYPTRTEWYEHVQYMGLKVAEIDHAQRVTFFSGFTGIFDNDMVFLRSWTNDVLSVLAVVWKSAGYSYKPAGDHRKN